MTTDGDLVERLCAEDALSSELALSPAATSVRTGRQFAARTLSEWDVPPGPVQDAVLIVSELVTNAIRHGCPPIRLRLRRTPDALAIEVDDGDGALPHGQVPPPQQPSGRGLPIVAALSRGWTADPTGTGKTVRSVLALAG